MLVHERLLRTDPAYARARIASENSHVAVLQGLRSLTRTGVTSIPVVVHVVYNTAQQNVSSAQINSQIAVLNRDFRKTNADIGSVPAGFAALSSDSRVQLLATTDPEGNRTSGITRTRTARTSFSDQDEIKSAATGGHDAWPADRYLNIWVSPRLTSPVGDLLGYAQFPGGPAATDGVVILYTAFGTTGSAAAPFNHGRTTTHEIGHWLNLRHIWGDDGNGCNGSDFVADTPNQAGPNYGTPAFPHITCSNGPNGDMFMNYMDYVDDIAMFMFTAGQVVRVQTCLDTDRSTIGTPATLPTAVSIDQPTMKVGDDVPTMKFRDDLPTLKFRDDGPTRRFQGDSPYLKIFHDGLTLPQGGAWWHGAPIPAGRGSAGMAWPPAAPFVLSTPHHSTSWTHSFPQAARQARAMLELQIRQYEDVLGMYAQADAAGQLSSVDRQQAEALYQDYLRLIEEIRQTFGG
jgi:hypothetical protein